MIDPLYVNTGSVSEDFATVTWQPSTAYPTPSFNYIITGLSGESTIDSMTFDDSVNPAKIEIADPSSIAVATYDLRIKVENQDDTSIS